MILATWTLPLAQLSDGQKQEQLWSGLLWFGLVVGVLIVGLIIAWRVGKRFKADALGSTGGAFFDLEELRRMHEEGKITPAEYEILKRRAVDELRSKI
jgi:hypothetical protein